MIRALRNLLVGLVVGAVLGTCAYVRVTQDCAGEPTPRRCVEK